jgi:hypothetical protein
VRQPRGVQRHRKRRLRRGHSPGRHRGQHDARETACSPTRSSASTWTVTA